MAYFNFNKEEYPKDKKYDFTIIGAGTAGILLAIKLAEKGRKILIIESGQFGLDSESQKLNNAISSGKKMGSHNWGRKRAIGGTTLAWGGQALPYCEIDFKKRDWVENSGWPISMDDLNYHYSRANEFLGIDLLDYREEVFERIKLNDPGFDQGKIDFHVSKWAKEKDFSKLLNKKNISGIDIIYNSVLRNIYKEGKKIASIEIVNMENKAIRFPISNLILANGTIEAVRTLLYNKLSNSEYLGKEFMDHPCIEVGLITKENKFKLQSQFAPHIKKGHYYSMRMSLSQDLQVNEKLLNCSAGVMFMPKPGQTNPYAEIRMFLKGFNPGHLFKAIKNSGALFSSLLIFLKHGFHFKGLFEGKVVLMAEQEPSLSSTISLLEETDHLGIPVPNINWFISHKTWDTVVATAKNVKAEFKRLGLGDVILYPHIKREETNWMDYLSDVCHHLGGARMSDKPEEGVVDKNLKIWGIENLYICSPAVFPTGSHSNPGLTLLALSNRLSDYLLKFAVNTDQSSQSLADTISSASISF